MCGLAGFIDFQRSLSFSQMEEAVGLMTASLTHRGPDGGGLWVNFPAGVALGHRRLSIIDLSPAGSQPMVSANGQYTLVYNGEIFNHQDLRKELERKSYSFRGHSDTEVLLSAFQEWGVEKTCSQLIGMYAFALWDEATQTLVLGRDPLGIKPLYWGRNEKGLFFGSERRALLAHPFWVSQLSPRALEEYVHYGYVPAPFAIDEGMEKLRPGTLKFFSKEGQEKEVVFWDGLCVAQKALKNRSSFLLSEEETIHELETLLRDAVHRQMESDVPLGAFLSGGIDSSLVVALMQSQSATPVQTFSIGFTDPDYDEAPYARKIAQHLGTHHTEAYMTPQMVMDLIPQIPQWYDEPFADSSQLPTFLVSQMARRHVTVSLSGDGGDELFAGYYRYQAATHLWAFLEKTPLFLRKILHSFLKKMTEKGWERSLFLLPEVLSVPQLSHKLQKVRDILEAPTDLQLYKKLVTFWEKETLLKTPSSSSFSSPWEEAWPHLPTFLDRMQLSDMISYLPDDILVKVDRATMAVGLEGRVPLLDPRVVELAWSLPLSFKQRKGQSKWILRQILKKYVPAPLFERPKMGFGIPLGLWLKGPLRGWAEDLLSPASLKETGIFNPQTVQETWNRHLEGKENRSHHLWILILFQQWYAARKDQSQADKKCNLSGRQPSPLRRKEENGILLYLF